MEEKNVELVSSGHNDGIMDYKKEMPENKIYIRTNGKSRSHTLIYTHLIINPQD